MNGPGSARWTPSGTYEAQGALPTPDSERGGDELAKALAQLDEARREVRERDDEVRLLRADNARLRRKLALLGGLPS